MKLYCIVHTADGAALPAGGSRAEFSATKAPRLFARKVDAMNCLACWLEGRWYNDIDEYGDGAGPIPLDSPNNEILAKCRKGMDIRIVECHLSFEGDTS